MDGLECSEILLSRVNKLPTLRFDPEYYKKSYLIIEDFIKRNTDRFVSLEDLSLSVDASAFYPSLEPFYNTGDIPFIRVADVKDFIDYDNCVNIPIMGEDFKTLNLCKEGDIVLTKGGRVGTAGLITRDSYVTRDLIFINSSKLNKKDYVILYLYFCTDFVFQQMIRSSSMTAQPHLTITLIRDLPIACFSDKLKYSVMGMYDTYNEYFKKSKALYKEAETLLKKAIGVEEIKQITPVYSKKSIRESLFTTDRLDAEYYQPKYDRLFSTLSNYTCKPLGGENGLVIFKKSIEPGSEYYQSEGVPFIRVSDISKFEIEDPEIHLPLDIVDNIEDLYPEKDTILFSKDGSVGIAYKVEDRMEIITSGALLHLTIKNQDEILPDYLTLVLNSPIVQLQAERDTNGAIIQHWKPSEIEKVVIPVLDMDKQIEISDKVKESFALRKKSKRLLEDAKRAVEIAIEQDEESAIEWLKDRVDL